jgi:hypothetical protein
LELRSVHIPDAGANRFCLHDICTHHRRADGPMPGTMSTKRCFAAAIAGCWCVLAGAGPTPMTVRAEVDALLGKLESSGCQFNRNGSWHSAAEAKAHLLGAAPGK